MSTADVDVLAPKELILPSLVFANQLSTALTGTLAMSGVHLIVFNGSTWNKVTTT